MILTFIFCKFYHICKDYNEIRQYKLEKMIFPADTDLSNKLLDKSFGYSNYLLDALKNKISGIHFGPKY